jgi:hypothetical protein
MYAAENVRQATVAGRRWGLFFAISLTAALITPHGVTGLLFPIRLTGMTMALAGITEWEPSSLANNSPLIIWLLLMLFVALFFGFRAAVTRVAMLMLLIYMAFAHYRYTELLALAAPLLVADALAETRIAKIDTKVLGWGEPIRPAVLAAAAIVSAAVMASFFAVFASNPVHGADRFTPKAAVDWALARHLDGPVLNSYNFGGYLIFRGVAPFIDGRVELYGQDFVIRDFAVDQLPTLLDAYRIAWTLFDPSDPRNLLLDRMPAWQKVYADTRAVIYIRRQ